MSRRRRSAVLGAVAVLAAVTAGIGIASAGSSDAAAVHESVLSVAGTPEVDGKPVSLDATLFVPERTPAPAVLLAHGFGGDKHGMAAEARRLAQHGYVVLTYTARGFGFSGGLVHIDSPDYEVADASRLLDLLAARPEVLLDRPGDPRVGVAGPSYGGGLALLLAAQDKRVDAIAPQITWNDLGQALFPQQAVGGTAPGVLKRGWAGVLFGSALQGGSGVCGTFAPDVCRAYLASAQAGAPVGGILPLLKASSPVLSRITAPTLLLQGQTDGLFPLSQATANAAGIAAPVKQVWFAGGHDGGDPQTSRLRSLTLDWFGRYLKRDGSAPDTRFEVTAPAAAALGRGDSPGLRTRVATGPATTTTLPLDGSEQTALSPPGGSPAALTSIPGASGVLGSVLGTVGGLLGDLPGQSATFQTAPLDRRLEVVGAPTVSVQVASTSGEATLFAKLLDVAPDGTSSLPKGLVAPVHLTGLPPAGRTVQIALPSVVLDVPAGHRLRLSISSTDQAYAVPTDARAYRISLSADHALTLPLVPTRQVGGGSSTRLLAIGGGALLLVLLALLVLARTRRGSDEADPELTAVPLVITDLGKAYQGGYRAVSELSFRVEAGQVLGLLGPNGAGKTTTLRMLMGLILPTEGSLTVFGHRVRPGAPVLSRIGSFVEGPGFLPHLSGTDNLELFWRATGRPLADAHLETALEVAGLGDDLSRRVKTYSQGMRQRLAIAQAMLGLPDLLVLDEPTNGLDPPQIREMRDVLAGYAASGRTVIVSSHLLAEVEQTCSHVVVMHHGRLVAQGPVAELVGSATSVVVDVDDPARAAVVAGTLPGAQDVVLTDTGFTLRLVGTSRSELVRALVAAGVAVERLAPQRGLEEAFLALVGEDG